jgi:aldehyde:ferredoxin oxidoreductase
MTGQPITRDTVARMVDDYYIEQGWDISTGIPTKARLNDLGLLED